MAEKNFEELVEAAKLSRQSGYQDERFVLTNNIEITEEVIAACELVIDTNSFKKDAMQNTITLPLIAAKDFVKTINKPVATKGTRQTKKQILLHEGDNNGSISLTISAS